MNKRFGLAIALLFFALTIGVAQAQTAVNEEVEKKAILLIEDEFNKGWNDHDAARMVESLEENVQFITVNGVLLTNRADSEKLLRQLHSDGGPFKNSTRETPQSTIKIRFLTPDVAVVTSKFRIIGDAAETGPREGVGTRLVQKLDGKWWTITVQNTDITAGRRDLNK